MTVDVLSSDDHTSEVLYTNSGTSVIVISGSYLTELLNYNGDFEKFSAGQLYSSSKMCGSLNHISWNDLCVNNVSKLLISW